MIMSWFFTLILAIACICAVFTGSASALAAAVPQGAQAGITLGISIAGSICLWSGVSVLIERIGLTKKMARLLHPLLKRLFPHAASHPQLSQSLSGNICANLLGLGNAATPMGIRTVKGMLRPDQPDLATDEMCRLIVLNTASIQLIPANVAALRTSLGCTSPFDLLPAVWLSSLLSAGMGLLAAWLLGKLWKHG